MIATHPCHHSQRPQPQRMSKKHMRRLTNCRRRLQREERALSQRVAWLRHAYQVIAKQRRRVERLIKQLHRLQP